MNKQSFLRAVRKKFPDGAHFTQQGVEDFASYAWDKGNTDALVDLNEQTKADLPDFMKGIFDATPGRR